MSFKENWNKVDETCPTCNQVTKRQRGITRQNMKRLLIPQFNVNEVVITFILIMVIAMGFVYLKETETCRDWISSMFQGNEESCKLNCLNKCQIIAGLNNSGTEYYDNFSAKMNLTLSSIGGLNVNK